MKRSAREGKRCLTISDTWYQMKGQNCTDSFFYFHKFFLNLELAQCAHCVLHSFGKSIDFGECVVDAEGGAGNAFER